MGSDPGKIYTNLTREYGVPFYDRIDARAIPEQKEKLKILSASQIKYKELAGENIENLFIKTPGNNAAIGGLKVVTKNGWFAASPSVTEDIYKIYDESVLNKDHLKKNN
jgi:phosphoglucomutase